MESCSIPCQLSFPCENNPNSCVVSYSDSDPVTEADMNITDREYSEITINLGYTNGPRIRTTVQVVIAHMHTKHAYGTRTTPNVTTQPAHYRSQLTTIIDILQTIIGM